MSQAGTADAGESSSGASEGGRTGTHGGGEGQGGGTGGRFRAVVGAYAVSGYGNYLNLIALSLF
ncbi:MFS transporter, partial [Streptomyces albidoflavus]